MVWADNARLSAHSTQHHTVEVNGVAGAAVPFRVPDIAQIPAAISSNTNQSPAIAPPVNCAIHGNCIRSEPWLEQLGNADSAPPAAILIAKFPTITSVEFCTFTMLEPDVAAMRVRKRSLHPDPRAGGSVTTCPVRSVEQQDLAIMKRFKQRHGGVEQYKARIQPRESQGTLLPDHPTQVRGRTTSANHAGCGICSNSYGGRERGAA